jgi:hypothetical protein
MEQYTILPFMNQKDYKFSLDRRRRLYVASKLKNSCFTCSISHLPPSLFHQQMHYSWMIKYVTAYPHYVYAHEKIIGHSEWCKMAHRCDQVTLKVVFTVCPPMLYP